MSSAFIKNYLISIKCFALKTKHLACNMSINGVEGIFLIDSGASNSCIDKRNEKKYKLEKFKKSYSASGAGNSKFDVYKSKQAKISHKSKLICDLNFLLIDMESINNALNESDNIKINGIIGADLLTKKKGTIDYKNETLYF
tara:strand:- start:114 stop:539 length:426 start_codon:yes stop_codon:yes gene_type:complete